MRTYKIKNNYSNLSKIVRCIHITKTVRYWNKNRQVNLWADQKPQKSGLLWSHRKLYFVLQCQHPTLVPVLVPAAPLLIQLSTYGLGQQKVMEDGLRPLTHMSTWQTWVGSWILTLDWLSSTCCGVLGSEPAQGRSLSLSSLQLFLSFFFNLYFEFLYFTVQFLRDWDFPPTPATLSYK